ncbi:MAG: hypothetical protein AB7K24_08670 [Gemmataceae bacterium]
MKRERWLLVIVALALLAAGCDRTRSATPFNCIGHWRVADGAGQPYFITVNANHTASSSLPHHGAGSWSVDKHAIRIVWQNHCIDYLVVSESGVSRVGLPPGDDLEDIPDSTSKAERVESVPVQ